ncbi:hypothetical protein IFM89_034039 [Coptis chinensis]|uniref:NPH3 domain-containing protein n=1 Tax=Coptis chinensis TaxID=261450 RepID=A0A835ISJ7_9MAGN|nr:hypothetical protein IFM89_034039 [Coptis chinensis]
MALRHYTPLYGHCPRKEVCGILLPSAFEDAIEDLGLEDGVMLDCTISCGLDLERRIGSQLEIATLDDILIPSFRPQ